MSQKTGENSHLSQVGRVWAWSRVGGVVRHRGSSWCKAPVCSFWKLPNLPPCVLGELIPLGFRLVCVCFCYLWPRVAGVWSVYYHPNEGV